MADPAGATLHGTLGDNRAVRLLRAKAAELEARVLAHTDAGGELSELTALVADVALLASLLADDIEYRHTPAALSRCSGDAVMHA